MSTAVANPLLTRREAAEYLGIREQTLACWASSGRYGVPFIRVGRLVKYRLRDLEAWLASRTEGTVSEGAAR